jgi:hypothetical protein
MKSPIQTIALIVAIVGVLFGVTFVRQYVKTTDGGGEGPELPPGTEEKRLYFPVTVLEGNPESELHLFGHHDFWFQNTFEEPIEIGFEKKSCKCSKVEVLALAPGAEQQCRQWFSTAATCMALDAPSGVFNTLQMAAAAQDGIGRLEAQNGGWQLLDQNKTVIAPAQGAGFVRLSWEGRAIGAIRLTAKIWAQSPGNPRTRGGDTSLEAPVVIVPGLQVWPDKLPLPADLNANDEAQVQAFVWSATRAGFTVSAREESNDPCFECTCTPVSGEDFDNAVSFLHQRGPTSPLTIYKIAVTVHERVGDHQMDLGPFVRKIVLTSDQLDFHERTITVEGMVRGEIQVGGVDAEDQAARRGERDKIVLRVFPSARGTKATVPINSNQPGLKLSLDSKVPSYLEADLKQVGDPARGGHWDLTVTVPPNRATGRMPVDSVIVLKTQTDPPRRIRIPVVGKATLP